MKIKRSAILFLFAAMSSLTFAQERQWVFFTDKADLSGYQASDLLSESALRNRARQGISLDSRDFPVNETYLEQVSETGALLRHKSRWFNAVSVTATSESLEAIRQLPFVKDIRPVATFRSPNPVITSECDTAPYLGTAFQQLGMIGIDDLHQQGFKGEGVTVAVFDNGFYRVDSLPGMAHLFEEGRIAKQWDFVSNEENVFDKCIHCMHGTYVFSILAAVQPGGLYGGAPEATYLLFRTENDSSETHQEEDNWIAAAELADSLGAQIFTTSLGYSTFDEGEGDYSLEDLDGNTALITRAADIAASRGILVVNSAGNEGNRGIVAPADGDSVLAIGAVDECGVIGGFSSRGPSGDGRIKPDIVAMGVGNSFYYPDGRIRVGSGTSFSCPMVTGLAACLMQKHPELSAWDVHRTLIQSGDRYETPDMVYGHGLPSASRFEAILGDSPLPNGEYADFRSGDLIVYPNPATHVIHVAWIAPVSPIGYDIVLIDASGRRIKLLAHSFSDKEWQLSLPTDINSGLYILELTQPEAPDARFVRKVVVR
ncbi:MAG: S8 family serine peptidase [Bacteroidia bacterium]|nr:S8 family serine peptidase [Bacteroidia bacterium]